MQDLSITELRSTAKSRGIRKYNRLFDKLRSISKLRKIKN